ncbi:MAG: hypothetical protein ABIZ05_17920 [Pseudonocardiaceae bacterium]
MARELGSPTRADRYGDPDRPSGRLAPHQATGHSATIAGRTLSPTDRHGTVVTSPFPAKWWTGRTRCRAASRPVRPTLYGGG